MSVEFKHVTQKVCSILINRPHKRNAVDLETITNLRRALQEFDDNDNYHVAVIGGKGGNFCAGYDLNEILDRKTGLANIKQVEQMMWPIGQRLTRRKITVAAIDGHAAGFGFELALKCDFRVAEHDSRLGFLNRRFGVPIMNGGTVILPRLIGFARAAELIATGKAQLAPEALQYGAITHIADIGCAHGRSLNLARCLAKFEQKALRHDLNQLIYQDEQLVCDLFMSERNKALEFLKKESGPLENVAKFLRGELGRHGNTDMGNLVDSSAEVTL